MPDSVAVVSECNGGWCIGTEDKDGTFLPLTFHWETKEEAEQFLRITRLDLKFIPSRLL